MKCPLLFCGIQIRADGIALPCCKFRILPDTPSPPNAAEMDLQEIVESVLFRTVQSKNLNPECHRCDEDDAAGIRSMRSNAIEQFGQINSPIPKSMNFSFNNVCNAACIMCDPLSSSRWATFIEEHGVPHNFVNSTAKIVSFEDHWNDDSLKQIEKIDFAESESLLQQPTKTFLQRLERLGSLSTTEILISTNAGFIPDKEVINLFLTSKNPTIQFSIDAIGKLNNYHRWPLKWEVIKQQLDFWSEKDIRKTVRITLTSLNVLNVAETINWFETNYPDIKITLGRVHSGLFNPYIIPLEYRVGMLEKYNGSINIDYLCKECPEDSVVLRKRTLQFIEWIKETRGMDARDYFPLAVQALTR